MIFERFNNFQHGVLDSMEEIISMEKENESQIVGHPDYSLPECRECRDCADPNYKECLTRIVDSLN